MFTSLENLEAAVSNSEAKKVSVASADADVQIATDGLNNGNYKVIAVGELGNVSQKSTGTVILYRGSEASRIVSIEENETGDVLAVTFSAPVYPYYGNTYRPEDPNMWVFTDASSGGVVIQSVTLDTFHIRATIVLSGSVGASDRVRGGDFHTIEGICFNFSFVSGTRDSSPLGSGVWNIGGFY